MSDINVLFRAESSATAASTPAVADRSDEAMLRLRDPFAAVRQPSDGGRSVRAA